MCEIRQHREHVGAARRSLESATQRRLRVEADVVVREHHAFGQCRSFPTCRSAPRDRRDGASLRTPPGSSGLRGADCAPRVSNAAKQSSPVASKTTHSRKRRAADSFRRSSVPGESTKSELRAGVLEDVLRCDRALASDRSAPRRTRRKASRSRRRSSRC